MKVPASLLHPRWPLLSFLVCVPIVAAVATLSYAGGCAGLGAAGPVCRGDAVPGVAQAAAVWLLVLAGWPATFWLGRGGAEGALRSMSDPETLRPVMVALGVVGIVLGLVTVVAGRTQPVALALAPLPVALAAYGAWYRASGRAEGER
jgi:hypothetical protein